MNTVPRVKYRLPQILVVCGLALFFNSHSMQRPLIAQVVDNNWLSGVGFWNDFNHWVEGVVPDNTPDTLYNAMIDSNAGIQSIVTISGTGGINQYTIGSLFLDDGDELIISSNANLGIEHRPDIGGGFLANSGTIFMNDVAAGQKKLVVHTIVEAVGGGEIWMDNNAFILDDGGFDGFFRNQDNHVQGAGFIGNNELRLANLGQGIFHANLNGQTLRVEPRDGVDLLNDGSLRASGGGILDLVGFSGGVVDNSNGDISAFADSTVRLVGSVNVSGGLVASVGTGRVTVPAAETALIDNVQFLGTIPVAGNLFLDGTNAIDMLQVTEFGRIIVNNETTLVGTGTVELLGDVPSYGIVSTAGNTGHLINVDADIAGRGQVGSNVMRITNQGSGSIRANFPGETLTIRSSHDFDLINQGALLAENGGTLQLTGFLNGVLQNADGMIRAGEGSTVELADNINILGGGLDALGDGQIVVRTFESARLESLLLGSPIDVENNAVLLLAGTINNSDIRLWGAATGAADLVFNDDATLNGNSVIHMNGASARIYTQPGAGNDGRLTNVNNLIRGQGTLGANRLRLTNLTEGTIDADVDGQTMTLHTVTGSPFTNAGTIQASNGGILVLKGASFVLDNANGLIRAHDGSRIELENNIDIFGGVVDTSGDGQIVVNEFHTCRLDSPQFLGPIDVENNAVLKLVGTITNSDIRLHGAATGASDLVFNEDATLQGDSVIHMNGTSARIYTQAGAGNDGRLTNVNNLIRGQGTLGANRLRLTNLADGTIDADVDGQTLTIHTATGAPFVNSGLIQSSGGGILAIKGFSADIDNTNGTIQALDDCQLILEHGFSIVGGNLQSVGSGEIIIPQSHLIYWRDLIVAGGVQLGGTLQLTGPFTNLADVELLDSASTITIANLQPPLISGTGTIDLAHSSSRIIGITNNNGFTIDGGKLTGTGEVHVDTRLIGGATIAAGNSIGTLQFPNGNLTHTIVDNSVIEVEMRATSGTPGIDWDFIDVAGTLDFADDVLPSGVVIRLITLDSNGNPGLLDGFDGGSSFSIPIASAASISGFTPPTVTFDLTGFANEFTGRFCARVEPGSPNTLCIDYLTEIILGDLNGDCVVNLLDVAPFVDAVASGQFVAEADINQDGAVNLLDVEPFVDLLAG